MDEHHPLKGLCCVFDNKIVGLAHYREIPSSLEGKTMDFLDDLIVHKKFRRNGIAEKTIKKTSIGLSGLRLDHCLVGNKRR